MKTVEAEFRRREEEIDEFLAYLATLEKTPGVPTTLMATMKASAVLMIYNLVESTMTNTVQFLFDHFKQKSIGFLQLNDTVKVAVLQHIKRRNSADLVAKMRSDSVDIAIACFERKEVFSGNVDARKIRETLEEFGVSTTKRISEKALLEIKNARNDLAHGTSSFVDQGRTYSANDLLDKKTKVGKVLEQTIFAFDAFITATAYA